MGVVFLGVALFWSAGRVNWWPAWALIAITAAWVGATALVIIRGNPALLAERLGPRKGAKRWDTGIMSIYGLLQLAVLVLAGFDQRYSWTTGVSPLLQVSALIGCSLGYALIVWATASNAFFSQIVRIQSERGHTVSTGGPYRYVRHPGYAGSILTSLTTPILLASNVALVLGVMSALLMIIRTLLEDRTLRLELPGYVDYTEQVRRRLVPLIW